MEVGAIDPWINNEPNLRVHSPNQMRNQPVVATMEGVGDEAKVVERAAVGDFSLQSVSRDDATEDLAEATVTPELWERVVKRGKGPNNPRGFLIDGNGL